MWGFPIVYNSKIKFKKITRFLILGSKYIANNIKGYFNFFYKILCSTSKKNLWTILSLQLLHKIGGQRNNNNNTLPSPKPQMGPHDGFDHVICLHAGLTIVQGTTRLEGHFSKSLVIKHLRGLSF